MHLLCAPDSFKGTISARAAADAIASGFGESSARPFPVTARPFPVTDGGEGTLEVLQAHCGGSLESAEVTGPLTGLASRRCSARFLRQPGTGLGGGGGGNHDRNSGGGTVIIEMAEICGLGRVAPGDRNPLRTSTFGVGELIRRVIESAPVPGKIVVTIGGTSTCDGGAGLLQALGFIFLDSDEKPLPTPITAADLPRLAAIRPSRPLPESIRLIAAVDVTNPLLGPDGAVSVYAPQKGATAADLQVLEAGLRRLVECLSLHDSLHNPTTRDHTEADHARCLSDLGADRAKHAKCLSNHGTNHGEPGDQQNAPPGGWLRCDRPQCGRPGDGAGGGAAFGLRVGLGAIVVSGIDWVLDQIDFDAAARTADLVITGEGRLDHQTHSGKAMIGVARRAQGLGKPVAAIVGSVDGPVEPWLTTGGGPFETIIDLTAQFGAHAARSETAACLAAAARQLSGG